MGLEELAKKYGTDKLEHGYIPYYEKYLPEEPGFLLEIGCYKGASVRMWNEYFQESYISVFDLFQEFDIEEEIRGEGIRTYRGDASYPEDLKKLYDYNVIIDDGSHNSYDQIVAFITLFLKKLCNGGVYVIEDLHCCKDSFYWNRGITKFEDTILYALQSWNKEDGLKLEGVVTQQLINEQIKDVKLFDDKIAFIFKK